MDDGKLAVIWGQQELTAAGIGVGGGSLIVGRRNPDLAACRKKILFGYAAVLLFGTAHAPGGQAQRPSVRLRIAPDVYSAKMVAQSCTVHVMQHASAQTRASQIAQGSKRPLHNTQLSRQTFEEATHVHLPHLCITTALKHLC